MDGLERVLANGGRLVLGTTDYADWEWVITKKLCDWRTQTYLALFA
jgi:hypothetical protein